MMLKKCVHSRSSNGDERLKKGIRFPRVRNCTEEHRINGTLSTNGRYCKPVARLGTVELARVKA